MMHDYNNGLEIARKFLSKDSTNTKILKLNAYCYYLLKNYSDAERWFLKCNEKGDSSLFCYRYTALSFFMQEKYDTAVKYFLKAFEIDTSDAEMAYYVGASAYKSYSTNTDTGVYYFNKAVALEKHHLQFLSIVYSEMAEAYNNIFQSDTALYMLRRAHEIDPLKKSVLFKTAYQYDYWLKDKVTATKYYQQYLDSKPKNTESLIVSNNLMTYAQYAQNRINELKKKEGK
jgi:tetratricopeptide (TPR) repeat protein